MKVAGYGQKAGMAKFDLTMTDADEGAAIEGGVEYLWTYSISIP